MTEAAAALLFGPTSNSNFVVRVFHSFGIYADCRKLLVLMSW
jgi:hypothetical protein